MDKYTTDCFIAEDATLYREQRATYLTSHQLLDYSACPRLYQKRQAGLIAERYSEAYLIGGATHCLTLEGRAEFERRYVVGGPINPKTERPYGSETKAFAEWAKEQGGRAALSDDQFALISRLAFAVKSHQEAADLLREGIAEGVLRTENFNGVPCQARLDWFNPASGIVDLKTCENLSNFESDVAAYGYVRQMAFYRSLYHALTGRLPPVYLIAVEKREPYRCGVWLIAWQALCSAESQNADDIIAFDVSRQRDYWPTKYEGIRVYGDA